MYISVDATKWLSYLAHNSKSHYLGISISCIWVPVSFKGMPMVFCFQNCSYLLWEKFVLVSRKICGNNLSKQWKVRTIFETECFFNFPGGFSDLINQIWNFICDLETYRKSKFSLQVKWASSITSGFLGNINAV